jgi:hypothetical protein
MMLTESLKREIKALAKVLMVILVSVYVANQTPTFIEIALLFNISSIYERMNQTDFWIMRG